jgi:hypothetical protein
MKRWILTGLLGLSVLTSGCAVRATYYRHPYDRNYRYYDHDRNYRHYDYDRDYPAERRR